MKKALITGITGFAGSHLAEFLVAQQEYTISGTYNTSKTHKNLQKIQDCLDLHQVDLTDYDGVKKVLQIVTPDVIFHLAAFPSPAESFKNPSAFLTNNISAELNILQATKELGFMETKILIVSSSEMYGAVLPENLPINEDTPLRPVSPYGVSKITQDYLGLQYFMAYHMPIIRVRPFGHIGPRLSAEFAVSAFSKKIAEIEKGIREPVLHVGNLESRRDLTDVRDMVKAYALLVERGEVGEVYNAGRGESFQMKDILTQLLSLSLMTIEVKEDPDLLRPNDIPELTCDNTKIGSVTGWKAEIPLEKSLEDTLNYWRENS
jgi:GDP-4-dehydro-6-deoxy-D-mannose reductase